MRVGLGRELRTRVGEGLCGRRAASRVVDGRIRSGFAMTEPDVASSDARNIQTSIVKDGGDYVINGTKWWTTGAMDERCEILIVMGKTNPDADAHHQQSMDTYMSMGCL